MSQNTPWDFSSYGPPRGDSHVTLISSSSEIAGTAVWKIRWNPCMDGTSGTRNCDLRTIIIIALHFTLLDLFPMLTDLKTCKFWAVNYGPQMCTMVAQGRRDPTHRKHCCTHKNYIDREVEEIIGSHWLKKYLCLVLSNFLRSQYSIFSYHMPIYLDTNLNLNII